MASQRLLEQELFVRNLCVRAVPKTLNPKLVGVLHHMNLQVKTLSTKSRPNTP